jgi:hypothetical protein
MPKLSFDPFPRIKAVLSPLTTSRSVDGDQAPTQSLHSKLSHSGQDNYAEEMQLCAYQYARQQGTLAMS